jgi:hypothetical protein
MLLAVLAFHASTVVSRPEFVRLAWGDGAADLPMTIDRLVTDYVSRAAHKVARGRRR